VAIAVNGLEAVQMSALRRYDCVLMDCNMPLLDGWQAAAQIREREHLAGQALRGEGEPYRVPIVAVTANAMKGDREKCLAAGMDDCVTKPVTKQDTLEIKNHTLKFRCPPIACWKPA
jgi:CheY-like chemotaxis protein